MRLAVVGAGYVGLVTAVGLAQLGHNVSIGEADPDRIGLLQDGTVPFFEPGLEEALHLSMEAGTIAFHGDNREAVRDAELIFVAVPTPPMLNGDADVSSIDRVMDDIGPAIGHGVTIVIKSTVPVGTTRRLQVRIHDAGIAATVVSNPEFLQAGRALTDFFNPTRIVIGSDDAFAACKLEALFATFDVPVLVTDPVSAELIKYGSNAYLATRLSFVNELADLCAAVDADPETVLTGLGQDPRIGPAFLAPGPGFGGSCLPKDSSALVNIAEAAGTQFRTVEAALQVNAGQRSRNLDRVRQALGNPTHGRKVALWGLAFKAGTDDVRESPAMWLVEDLHLLGAEIQAYDELARVDDPRIERFGDPLEAVKGADVLVVATEWPEFREVNMMAVRHAMRGAGVVDLRGILDPAAVAQSGLAYHHLRRAGNTHRLIPRDRRSADEDTLSA